MPVETLDATGLSYRSKLALGVMMACAPCCSGSGGGSGGGGTAYCCQCERFVDSGANNIASFPDEIEATITNSVMGTRTITLTKDTTLGSTDTLGCAMPDNTGNTISDAATKAYYYGQYTSLGGAPEFFNGVDCRNGVPLSSELTPSETLTITIRCVHTLVCGDVWFSTATWVKHVSGSGNDWSYTANGILTVLSCSPLSFTQTCDIFCDNADPAFVPCNPGTGEATVVGFTQLESIEGSTHQLDADEVV